MNPNTAAVILAAGLGTRMKSRVPKVLHPVLGDASLLWVLRSLPPGLCGAVVVVHHGKEQVEAALAAWTQEGMLPCPVRSVDQGQPLGTGHAVRAAEALLDKLQAERVLILSGDVPLLQAASVARLATAQAQLLAMDLEDPTGYGRVIQAEDGRLAALVEEKDATPDQRSIRRVNGGAYLLPWPALKTALAGLSNANAQGEYYLTDAVVAVGRETPVTVETVDPQELGGMNSRLDQARLTMQARDLINAAWMREGVTFLDPATIYVGPRAALGRDVTLEPGVRLEGAVTVGEGTVIGQGSVLRNATLEAGVLVRPYSIIESATVGAEAVVGPFSRLREGTVLEAGAHVGNFVETKKALLRARVKANHLTYLGDCEIGEDTNIGAGVITCNYDGARKHRTLIGRRVFVGSDTQLVAPVSVGDDAIIGAGSTITQDVPAAALALSRTPQATREDGAHRLRAKQKG
jgi:bifunctional UDP-N-acetylglucosamine pyrophosphorylase/glucosamine-1-phosphate N-acetyltransferase